VTSVTIVVLLGSAAALLYLWYRERARRMSAERLRSVTGPSTTPADRDEALLRTIRPFPPRFRALPPLLAVVVAVGMWQVAKVPFEISLTAGLLTGVIAYLAESAIAEQRCAAIEVQLAEAIDLLVGSLRAGASLLAAFDSALQHTSAPLHQYFQEVAARIRLGDDPRVAIGELPLHIRLETVRLFAASLNVHWEVGGSLATTLSTVARTIRDRIELSRRVRAQSVEATLSVGVVLVIVYVLGYLMWREDPDRLEAFMRTDVGTGLVALVMGLQAFGLVWMSRLSRSQF
jgi:tight adherence protein B